jgi:hypothetical protein
MTRVCEFWKDSFAEEYAHFPRDITSTKVDAASWSLTAYNHETATDSWFAPPVVTRTTAVEFPRYWLDPVVEAVRSRTLTENEERKMKQSKHVATQRKRVASSQAAAAEKKKNKNKKLKCSERSGKDEVVYSDDERNLGC